jgi:hypothetical protein
LKERATPMLVGARRALGNASKANLCLRCVFSLAMEHVADRKHHL